MEINLLVYRAPSGQWSGILTGVDGVEVGRIGGCCSPEEVEETASEQYEIFEVKTA